MSTDFNLTVLEGRLVSDAEKIDMTDFLIAKFSIANNKTRKVKDEFKEVVSFFEVDAIVTEKQLENLKKGVHVFIEASAKQQRWEKDGKNNSKVIFEAKRIRFVNSNKSDSSADNSKEYADIINYDDIETDPDAVF